jgi:hypothetical protein
MKNANEILSEEIIKLQAKRAQDLLLLKDQWHVFYEDFKPAGAIKKRLLDRILYSKGLNNAIGIGAGMMSKKIWVGDSKSPVKRLIGTLLQVAISSYIAKHSDKIKTVGKNMFDSISKRTNTTE